MKRLTWNERLVHAMNARNVTQTQLARLVGVSNPTVHAWMTDQRSLSALNKAKVDDALRLPPRYLLEGVGEINDAAVTVAEPREPYSHFSESVNLNMARELASQLPAQDLLEFMRPLVSQMTAQERLNFVHLLSEPRNEGD